MTRDVVVDTTAATTTFQVTVHGYVSGDQGPVAVSVLWKQGDRPFQLVGASGDGNSYGTAHAATSGAACRMTVVATALFRAPRGVHTVRAVLYGRNDGPNVINIKSPVLTVHVGGAAVVWV